VQVVAFVPGPGSTTTHVVDAHRGALLQSLVYGVQAADLLQLPQPVHDGTADQHVFVLVPPGAGGRAEVAPHEPPTLAAFAAARPGLAFWRLDEAAGALRGFGFAGEEEVAAKHTLRVHVMHFSACS
jgi:hypothetical protein